MGQPAMGPSGSFMTRPRRGGHRLQRLHCWWFVGTLVVVVVVRGVVLFVCWCPTVVLTGFGFSWRLHQCRQRRGRSRRSTRRGDQAQCAGCVVCSLVLRAVFPSLPSLPSFFLLHGFGDKFQITALPFPFVHDLLFGFERQGHRGDQRPCWRWLHVVSCSAPPAPPSAGGTASSPTTWTPPQRHPPCSFQKRGTAVLVRRVSTHAGWAGRIGTGGWAVRGRRW